MRLVRADLSAPVLAILVTIGIIAAGLVLLAWFFWFAPQAGRAGSLQVLGTPVIVCTTSGANLTIAVRNVGNANVTITGAVVAGISFNKIYSDEEITTGGVTLKPGDSKTVIFESTDSKVQTEICGKYSVEGYLTTDYGVFGFSAAVQRS
ncbi:MAG: hypothetical protein ACP5KA_04555 [Desulfurococcaceae archaeon]